VSRLIRAVDFACQEDDGAIIVVFAESALRHAHVITRRIAAVMRHAVLEPERSRPLPQAMVTLACLKAADTAQSLVERVCERTATAAE